MNEPSWRVAASAGREVRDGDGDRSAKYWSCRFMARIPTMREKPKEVSLLLPVGCVETVPTPIHSHAS